MNDEKIIGVQQESTIAIVSALKAYVDLLDDSKEAGQKEEVMKILTRPEKETYQICISILVGIVVGRLGMKVDNSKRTESCVNAVYYFDTNLQDECSKLFCPSYTLETIKDPFSGNDEYYLSVGLNSGIKKSDFERKKLNLVIRISFRANIGKTSSCVSFLDRKIRTIHVLY